MPKKPLSSLRSDPWLDRLRTGEKNWRVQTSSHDVHDPEKGWGPAWSEPFDVHLHVLLREKPLRQHPIGEIYSIYLPASGAEYSERDYCGDGEFMVEEYRLKLFTPFVARQEAEALKEAPVCRSVAVEEPPSPATGWQSIDLAPKAEESPVLAFQAWAAQRANLRGPMTQDEYFLAQEAFYAAHPGKGPTSSMMGPSLTHTSEIRRGAGMTIVEAKDALTSEERQERIAQIKARLASTSEASWRVESHNDDAGCMVVIDDDHPGLAVIAERCSDPDAEFIAHARDDIPFLLAALEEAITRPTAPARDSKDIRALWDAINGHLPRCRDCADAKVPGTCDHDGEPCDLQTRAMLRIEAWKTAEAHIAELEARCQSAEAALERSNTERGQRVAELEQQVARQALIEPEVVWCSYDCPKADRVDGGVSIPAMQLVRRLDDEAGHQRVYCCPKCQREASVNFPPSGQLAKQETPTLSEEAVAELWRREMYQHIEPAVFRRYYTDLAVEGWDQVRMEVSALRRILALRWEK